MLAPVTAPFFVRGLPPTWARRDLLTPGVVPMEMPIVSKRRLERSTLHRQMIRYRVVFGFEVKALRGGNPLRSEVTQPTVPHWCLQLLGQR